MEDLIKKLTETAGINEEQAAKAIETVVNFIKEKL
jgi:nucleoid DNA-binding protein